MVIRGDLLSVDLSNVFQMLAMNRKRGILHVQNRENILEKRSLVLDADRIALLVPPDARDLGAVLVELGVLGYEEWSDARQKGRQFGVRPSDYIQKRGLVSTEDRERALTRVQEEQVLEIFLWKNVGFSLDEEAFPADDPARHFFVLDLVVMEAARRQDEWERVVGLIGGGRDIWKRQQVLGKEPEELSSVERIVLDHLDGVQSTREIIESTGMSRFQIDGAIARLYETDHVAKMTLQDLLETGDHLAANDRTADAIRLYKCAVRHDRRGVGLHQRLADCYWRDHRAAKAAAHWKFCAMTMLDEGRVRDALRLWQHVITILPTDFKAIEKALELLGAAGGIETDLDEATVETGNRLAAFWLDARNYEKAEKVARLLTVVLPGDPEFSLLLARCLVKLGRIAEAVEIWMRLGARLMDNRDPEAAIDMFKVSASYESDLKERALVRVAECRQLLERRKKRRVLSMAACLAALLLLAIGSGYWLWCRAARQELNAVDALAREATTEAALFELTERYDQLARRYVLTPAVRDARDGLARAMSRLEALNEVARRRRDADRNRRLEILQEASNHFYRAVELQRDLRLGEALEAYKASLAKAVEGDQASWADQKDRRVRERIRELEELLAAEEKSLAEFRAHRAAGRDREAYLSAQAIMNGAEGGLDAASLKVVSRRAMNEIVFPVRLEVAPTDAVVVIDGVETPIPATIDFSLARPKVEFEVRREGWRPQRGSLLFDQGGFRRVIALEREPVSERKLGDRIAALGELDGRLVAVAANAVVHLFEEGSLERSRRIEPDGLLSLACDPAFSGSRLAFATSDGRVRLVESDGRKETASAPFEGGIQAIAWAGSCLLVASGGASGRIDGLDPQTLRPIAGLALGERVMGLSTSGERAAVSLSSQSIVFVDARRPDRNPRREEGPFAGPIAAATDGFWAVQHGLGLVDFDLDGIRRGTSWAPPRPVSAGPARIGGMIAMILEDGSLVRIPATRRPELVEKTASDLLGKLGSRIVDAGSDHVLLDRNGSVLVELDLATGRILGSFGDRAGPPLVAIRHGGKIVVGAADNVGTLQIFGD